MLYSLSLCLEIEFNVIFILILQNCASHYSEMLEKVNTPKYVLMTD